MTVSCLCRFQLDPQGFVLRLFHKTPWKGLDDERWEVSLRPTHGLLAKGAISTVASKSTKDNYRIEGSPASISFCAWLCSIDLPA